MHAQAERESEDSRGARWWREGVARKPGMRPRSMRARRRSGEVGSGRERRAQPQRGGEGGGMVDGRCGCGSSGVVQKMGGRWMVTVGRLREGRIITARTTGRRDGA